MAHRGGPGLILRGARAPQLLLAAVGLVALGARLGPVLAAGALRGSLSYDEGVHLVVAQRLLAGQMPYQDVFFAHPPGIVLAQVPVALLAEAVGEPTALAVSRCAAMVLGALTALLVARLLLPRGRLAAVTGGLVAALAGPAVAADRVALLEPALSLALVVALTALASVAPGRAAAGRDPGAAALGAGPSAGPAAGQTRPTPVRQHRVALAIGGLALGLALSVKVWAALDIAVLTVAVLARTDRAAARRWCAWAAGGVLVVVGPFAALAPGRLWHDVIVTQVSRPRVGGLSLGPVVDRVAGLEPLRRLPGAWPDVAVVLVVVVLVLVVALAPRSRRPASWAPRSWPDPAWWGAVGLVHLVALVLAPSYYLHYGAFLAVPAALLLGAGAGRLARLRRARGPVAVGVAVLGAVLVLLLPPLPPGARVDHAVLAAQTSRGCVWAREVELLLLADVSRTSIEDGCPGRADLFGERMAASATDDPAAALAAIDARVADELAASQTALLVASDPLRELGPRSRAYLREHFAVATTTGRIEVWQRRD